jgi:two-component system phosphate regulon sensor histidine kinase PhoR
VVLYAAVVAVLAAVGALDGASAAAAAGALAGALAVGGSVVWNTARSLRGFAVAARALAGGNLASRVEGRNEIADAFNQMARSLEELVGAASRERNRLVAALNSSVDAIVAVDPEGHIAFANSAAGELLQHPQDELAGQAFAWVLPEEQIVEALRSSREEGRRETILIERPNRQYLRVITTPILGGGEWAALLVFHDLTDVRRTEQVRRDFVANVSHELRTPLASVKSVIETLEGGALDDRAVAQDFLRRAGVEVDRLVQLVEELLELSRIESGQMPMARAPVALADVLERAVERLRREAQRSRVDLALEVPESLPAVTGDEERLERVAVNLVHNAIKFTPVGGAVRVRAEIRDGAVLVSVSDTGAGIAPEDLPRIFERFYKTDRARGGTGTGLGLAIVKHTIEAHGGAVAVESAEGRGSSFSFSLPAARPS